MKSNILALAVALTVIGGIQCQSASLIDFEGLAVGPLPGGTVTLTVNGVPVTFSGLNLAIDIGNPVAGNHTLHSGSYYDPITVTFGGGFSAGFVEIQNVFDNTSTIETDIIRGDAFAASGILLSTVTSSNMIIHLDGPGIARVVYDDVGQTGFALDNFNFQVVPEPTTLGIVGAGGFVFLTWCLRRWRIERRKFNSAHIARAQGFQ